MDKPDPMQLETKTTSGPVRGTAERAGRAFKGVPYAAPPFGDLRFAAPAPPAPWDGVRECTAYGPTALKPPYPAPFDALLPEPVVPGEDVLNLNVWTPDGARAACRCSCGSTAAPSSTARARCRSTTAPPSPATASSP